MSNGINRDPLTTRPLAPTDLDHVLSRTEGLWQAVRGGQVLLTGGTGFFGRWLAETFLHAHTALNLGARLTILSRAPHSFAARAPHLCNHPAVSLLQGDIRTFAFPSGHFAHIIHAATDAVVPPASSDEDQYTAIVDGTQRVLEFAAAAGTEKLLLTSSGAVYGPQPRSLLHVAEDQPFAPSEHVYTRGKRMAEALCAEHNSGRLHCTIARGFAFIGPHLPLRAHFAAGNFLGDVLAGRDVEIAGDGAPLRSYLYAADLAIWLWTILLRGQPGRAYNVGSEEAVSIRELAERTIAVVNPELRIHVAQQPLAEGAPARYVPSTQRARSELGLTAWIGLDESIRRTAAWHGSSHKAQP